ncbi:MAG: hypothetical protein QF687_02580 [Nitrospinaceae bacterium]|jgi:hypothetical protein|nr:hypothetical protein [Nitrospinaceae bacterium]
MENAPAPVTGTAPKPGTIVFGPARESAGEALVYSRLFRCRKDGFDFMGQVKIDSQLLALKMEVFNSNYFECFDVSKEEVVVALKKKLLAKLLSGKSLSEGLKETVRALLNADEVEIESSPDPELIGDGKIDLKEIFDRLNAEYFSDKIKADVEWGKKVNKKNLTSFRFGSYDPAKKLIRIHPRLDQGFVPRSVLELTVYHEMCHQSAPMKRKKGMWMAHHPEFKEKEREYRHYEEARTWEKANWKKLMGPASKKSGKTEISSEPTEIEEIITLAG